MNYEFLDHTADVKVRARGGTLDEVFICSAMALKETICGSIHVESQVERKMVIEARGRESLLCAFLEEFLFLLDAEAFLLAAVVNIEMCENRVLATVAGSDARRYLFSNSVKAVTYSEVSIREAEGEWVAEFVLDV